MTSFFEKVKLFYFGLGKIQQKLFPPVVLLILVFIIVRWANNRPDYLHEFNTEDDNVFKMLDDAEITHYLDLMTDTRSQQCMDTKYNKEELDREKVSIILDFSDHQFYDLKMTMESLLRHTPDELYKEIIILDDGSMKDAIRKESIAFLDQPRFKKVKAYRSENSEGSSLSRFKASKVATGSILVFLSNSVAVNVGWLEPLIDAIQNDRRVLAVPHADSLLTGFRFFKTEDNLINMMDWKLWTLFTESKEEGPVLTSPVMTGAAFAVDKRFLDGVGSFDESMDKGGGESLELSIRTWLCGGSIKVFTCSRVAVRNALSPQEVLTPRNFRRIVELWFDNRKPIAYRQGNHSYGMDESEKEALQARRNYFKKTLPSCDPFDTYLKDIMPELQVPPDDARYFGKLKCKTGYCVTTEGHDSGKLRLNHCKPHMYEKDMLFTLTTNGLIRCPMGHCLSVVPGPENDLALKFVQCDDSNVNQKWQRNKDGNIISSSSKNFCLTHGIEYGPTNKHYLDIKTCVPDDRPYQWQFIKY